MEYINAEKFLNESKEVQDIFLQWWKPSIGDLYTYRIEDEQESSELSCVTSTNVITATIRNKGGRIPLFTEGQLRRFIEEKFNGKVMVEYTVCENIVIKLCKEDEVTGGLRYKQKTTLPCNRYDLINSYWAVAVRLINK